MFEKVIFLDIDGVLNCISSKSSCKTENGLCITGIDKDKVQRLSALVTETKADIVLVSSWKYDWYKPARFLFDKPELSNHAKYLTKHLYKKGKLTIADKTTTCPCGRGEEIYFWLKMHPETKEWVILDDEDWAYYHKYDKLERHWVQTDDEFGLTDEDTTAALKILQGQHIGPVMCEERWDIE